MSEQMTLWDFTRQSYSIDKPIRVLELFAGYGSLSMALDRLGVDYEHYRTVEFDQAAINSYNAVHGTDFSTIDVTTVHGEDLGVVDKDKYAYILMYSFPCTDISQAGQMKGMAEGSGTRSSLLWEVKRILMELNDTDSLPDVLLMENVVAIHSEVNIKHLRKWQEFLHGLGYSNYTVDMNASDYGVAQNRDRTFMISILGNYNYKFAESIELTTCIEDYFEDLSDEQAMQLIVKSDKAKALLVELDGENKLS